MLYDFLKGKQLISPVTKDLSALFFLALQMYTIERGTEGLRAFLSAIKPDGASYDCASNCHSTEDLIFHACTTTVMFVNSVLHKRLLHM